MNLIISFPQLKKFRDLRTEDGSALVDNWRKIRDLNGRSVTLINTDDKSNVDPLPCRTRLSQSIK